MHLALKIPFIQLMMAGWLANVALLLSSSRSYENFKWLFLEFSTYMYNTNMIYLVVVDVVFVV